MSIDYKAAVAWAEQCIEGPDSNDANLAAAYLCLRKKAKTLQTLARLSDELCTAFDNAAEDIGGSRPIRIILAEFGPATDAALEALRAVEFRDVEEHPRL